MCDVAVVLCVHEIDDVSDCLVSCPADGERAGSGCAHLSDRLPAGHRIHQRHPQPVLPGLLEHSLHRRHLTERRHFRQHLHRHCLGQRSAGKGAGIQDFLTSLRQRRGGDRKVTYISMLRAESLLASFGLRQKGEDIYRALLSQVQERGRGRTDN